MILKIPIAWSEDYLVLIPPMTIFPVKTLQEKKGNRKLKKLQNK